jgi:type II secretory pathway pseudopilin PulG
MDRQFMKKGKRGFALVEVLITTAVISFTFIAILQMTLSSYVAGNSATKKGYATYLAQDLAEIVTNIRDTSANLLSSGAGVTNWGQLLYGCNVTNTSCDNYYYLREYTEVNGWKLAPTQSITYNYSTPPMPCYNCARPPHGCPRTMLQDVYDYNTDQYTGEKEEVCQDPRWWNLAERYDGNPNFADRGSLKNDDPGSRVPHGPSTGQRGIEHLGTQYYRYIYVKKLNKDKIQVRIIVSWKDGKNVRSVGQDLILANYAEML